MMRGSNRSLLLVAAPLLFLLGLPLFALISGATSEALAAGWQHPSFAPAMWLSARTSLLSLVVVVATGTPLAWWLARAPARKTRLVAWLVDVPIVLPPAVVGIALLHVLGRNGSLGHVFESVGVQVAFTTVAVVIAQVTISAPFYVRSATAAFARVDADLLLVARTLGHTRMRTFTKVAVPLALPGLLSGAGLAWGRALGEFGATLLFAGNMAGTSQTMPLAIYATLEADVHVALALALVLAGASMLLLVGMRQSLAEQPLDLWSGR